MALASAIDWGRFALPMFQNAAELAPAIAVLAVRRSWRDTASRIALIWLVYAAIDFVGFLRVIHLVPRTTPTAIFATFTRTVLLVPTVLEWNGGALTRLRYRIAAILTLGAALPIFWLGIEREYRLYARPFVHIALMIVVAVTLANVVRRAEIPLRRVDAFWICLAILLSYALTMLLAPVIETLYARNGALERGFGSGQLLLESTFSLLVAYGVTRREPWAEPPKSVGAR